MHLNIKGKSMGIRKYTQEDQLRIGEEIYDHIYTIYSAAAKYDISPYTARDYLRRYKGMLTVELK